MNEGLIPRRYAKALLKFAHEKGQDVSTYALMKTLSESFSAQQQLANVLNNPFVDAGEKAALINTAAAADDSNSCFADFVKLLIQNNRIGMTREIALAYLNLYRKANNIYMVDITTANELPQPEMKRLKAIIEGHLGNATVEYNVAVDPDLIGGFVVTIDSERLDASIKNELKQLRLKLLSK